ncbi:MAG: SMI1/KNR4 family protein [Myxococcota bacterium]
MEAKYVNWVREQIQQHAPDSAEPERVQALALAAYNLSRGAGTLFGMHWPESGLGQIDQLRDEALAQLAKWFDSLDDHDAVEAARFVQKHRLDVAIPGPILELLRQVESREGLELPPPSTPQIEAMGQRIASIPTPHKMAWLSVQAAAQSTMLALQRRAWEHEPFLVEPPASAAHLAALENELPFRLPDAFVHVMGVWGRTAFFTWSMPTPTPDDLPNETADIPGGGFDFGLWDLGRVLQMKAQCDIWRDACGQPEDSDAYRRWNRALPFAGEAGTYLALQVTDDPKRAPVIFLDSSNSEAEGHGRQLSGSLTEFLITWAELGFPGADMKSFWPFVARNNLSIDTEIAQRWRSFLFEP